MPATLETIARELAFLGSGLRPIPEDAKPRAGVRLVGDASVVVNDVQQDSRAVHPGDLFVARIGGGDREAAIARLEGFLRDALARGATAILHEGEVHASAAVPAIEVPAGTLRAALGVAASAVHGHPSFAIEVIAVTGTNGKTTTTHLLADAIDALCSDTGRAACGLIGTVGARIGADTRPTLHTTPEGDELARLLAWLRAQHATHVALEASSHALDQGRLAATRVRAAAFTNLTQDHLDYHHTMQAYYEAKQQLFTELHPGASIVCVDDGWGRKLAGRLGSNCLRVRANTDATVGADVSVLSAKFSAFGIEALVQAPGGRAVLTSKLLGAHNLENLMVSLGVLIALDFPLDRALAALASARPSAGRLELASDPSRDDVTVLVDYAHTPDALSRVLATLRPITAGRLVCVFGCGGDRDPTKRGPMGLAVEAGADVSFVTSDNPRTENPRAIVDAIVAAMRAKTPIDFEDYEGGDVGRLVEVDRAIAIDAAISGAAKGDVVLIAGKGHEDYQIIGTDKRPFSDLAEATKALDKRRAKLAHGSAIADGSPSGNQATGRGG